MLVRTGTQREGENRRFNIPPVDIFGMDNLTFTVKNIPSKIVMGVQRRTSNADGRSIEDIPACWQDFLKKNMASKIPNRAKTPAMFAVYSDYQSDWAGEYAYMIGSEVTKADKIPQGWQSYGFPLRHMRSLLQPGLCRTRFLGYGCRSGGRDFPGHILSILNNTMPGSPDRRIRRLMFTSR